MRCYTPYIIGVYEVFGALGTSVSRALFACMLARLHAPACVRARARLLECGARAHTDCVGALRGCMQGAQNQLKMLAQYSPNTQSVADVDPRTLAEIHRAEAAAGGNGGRGHLARKRRPRPPCSQVLPLSPPPPLPSSLPRYLQGSDHIGLRHLSLLLCCHFGVAC